MSIENSAKNLDASAGDAGGERGEPVGRSPRGAGTPGRRLPDEVAELLPDEVVDAVFGCPGVDLMLGAEEVRAQLGDEPFGGVGVVAEAAFEVSGQPVRRMAGRCLHQMVAAMCEVRVNE